MTKTSLKTLLGGTVAAIIAAFALAPNAQAACAWTGNAWDCASPAPLTVVVPVQNTYAYPQSSEYYVQGVIVTPPADFRYPGPAVH